MLLRRSLYLGVKAPDLNLDRYRSPHIDLSERLSLNGKARVRSLAFYCRRFGIPHDDTLKGEDMPALAARGDYETIRAHCLDDVSATAELARRLGVL